MSGNRVTSVAGLFQGLSHLSMLKLEDLDLHDIHTKNFHILPGLKFVYFDTFRYCRYVPTVAVCLPNFDGVTSTEDLLGWRTLRVAVWVMALVTLFANVVVIFCRAISRKDNKILKLFVKNLAAADLLMGVYLVVIGVQDAMTRGSFNSHALQWADSYTCILAGVLAMVSSETSVFILSFMSLERYLYISEALDGRTLSLRGARLCLAIIWLTSISLAFFPKMVVVRVYRTLGETEESGSAGLLLQRLRIACPSLARLQQETCYYILVDGKSGEEEAQTQDVMQVLGREAACQMWGLLGDPWLPDSGLHITTQLQASHDSQVLVEIGPRLTFTTAWSTNAVSICQAAGLTCVRRLERAHRYLVTASAPFSQEDRQKLVAALHDPMTQQEYVKPLDSFTLKVEPEDWIEVDVLGSGKAALQEINKKMGLAFDDWDVDYYTELFKTKVQRNPTTVELFDLAQSNSEHSRHWFFKGKYWVEGEKLPCSLMEMVAATNTTATTHPNNIIAFSDNSSGIKGWEAAVLVPSDPCAASEVKVERRLRHIILTAETHNFPTGVAPFSGATTGTGGRIRDVQAAGRGGHVVAGTAGYCFGNLLIPGYDLPWEEKDVEYPSNFAPSLEVAIEASNGASDYGNKFGEPIIAGFARSFGLGVGGPGHTERREWIKPIMFSGGIGTLDATMVKKYEPQEGARIVKVGGPVYRIGVGGGAASSIQVQGDNEPMRDLGAVQRGDAEMEQKMNRVIRGCLEMEVNPIMALHDQGAGGNANVLKELMEGAGGLVFRDSFTLGDPTLSTLEVWGAEYQESNALLVQPNDLPALALLAARERCPIDTVGYISGDNKVRLVEGRMEDAATLLEGAPKYPVNLHLDWVLGKMPKKEFRWTKERVESLPLVLPESLSVREALKRVLRLPSVASKRYLTNKVDRSVTGLVAQQQCVGPFHTPLADVAVTAASFFSKEGTATSIGEQPVKILVNPQAGARLTVLEAVANLAAAPVSHLKDVKCSANWMWPAKLPGEGWSLYQACEAMCDVLKAVGVGVDGGKDSLSMAARVAGGVVKAPPGLVVSTYAPCPDITKVVTPDLKSPGRGEVGELVWVRPVPGYARLAGSALAQVYGQVGRDCPDVDQHHIAAFIVAFNLIQELLDERAVLALHDISDGGLLTCLLEMCVAGWGGASVDVPPPPAPPSTATDKAPPTLAALFSEEVGWVMEVGRGQAPDIVHKFVSNGVPGTCVLGTTTSVGSQAQVNVHVGGKEVLNMTVLEVAKEWEETSYQLERLQTNPECAKQEFLSLESCTHTTYHVPFSYRDFVLGPERNRVSVPRVAVLREEGTNGDREMVAALLQAGFCVHDVTMSDLLCGETLLQGFKGVIFPGGFSYADVLGSAVGWAGVVRGYGGLRAALEAWRIRPDTFSLGVCNGCQLMALLGWLDPPNTSENGSPGVLLKGNISGRFESRWSRVLIEKTDCVLLRGMEGAKLGVWVAHGEGRFTFRSGKVAEAIESSKCVALRYLDPQDKPTQHYPFNPNGSQGGVAGLTSACGRHLALMPHPERCVLTWQWPHLAPPLHHAPREPLRLTAPWSKLFQNAFDWCLEHP
ncbi:phosphoribosylformylglycinamidine synthase-like isoform X3 [Scylla paramamosain]